MNTNKEPSQTYDYIPPTPQTGQSPLNPSTPIGNEISRESEASNSDMTTQNIPGQGNQNQMMPNSSYKQFQNNTMSNPIQITYNNNQNYSLQPVHQQPNNVNRGPSPSSNYLMGGTRKPATLGGGPSRHLPNLSNNISLGGGVPSNNINNTVNNRSRTRHQEYQEPQASLLSQKMLDDIVSKMTNDKIAINRDGTHDLIIELVNDIADRAILGISRLSQHRGSDTHEPIRKILFTPLPLTDVKTYFQTNYDNLKIEGHQHPNENFREQITVRNGDRPLMTENHRQRLDIIKKASSNT